MLLGVVAYSLLRYIIMRKPISQLELAIYSGTWQRNIHTVSLCLIHTYALTQRDSAAQLLLSDGVHGRGVAFSEHKINQFQRSVINKIAVWVMARGNHSFYILTLLRFPYWSPLAHTNKTKRNTQKEKWDYTEITRTTDIPGKNNISRERWRIFALPLCFEQ